MPTPPPDATQAVAAALAGSAAAADRARALRPVLDQLFPGHRVADADLLASIDRLCAARLSEPDLAEEVPFTMACLAARAEQVAAADRDPDGSWYGSVDCLERECEDYADPGPLSEDQFPCSHLMWVPDRVATAVRTADADTGVAGPGVADLQDLLASVWLYINWRYVTGQLTTAQKEWFADAIEASRLRDGEHEVRADRWWRETPPPCSPRPRPPVPGELNLTGLDALVSQYADWFTRELGPLPGLKRSAMKVFEEAGELCGATLKATETRHDGVDWQARTRAEAGDVLIALAGYAWARGWNLSEVVADRWREVSARRYRTRGTGPRGCDD